MTLRDKSGGKKRKNLIDGVKEAGVGDTYGLDIDLDKKASKRLFFSRLLILFNHK